MEEQRRSAAEEARGAAEEARGEATAAGAQGAGLRRDPAAAQRSSYDLIVIGGGIYGAMTALEAARRGLRPLLLERDDFGGATSWNSHRIVHGGLRYLQRLDLGRFFTSVRERRWYLRAFPEQVKPLPCLMPLYGEGARRPAIMRVALAANHLLSRHRNDGVRSDRRLESGGVMTPEETRALFPAARPEGLRGGALWYDAVMADSQRVLMETLRWACSAGARCLNYVEVTGIEVDGGRVRGVRAIDRAGTGRAQPGGVGDPGAGSAGALSFEAAVVINCAGPWVGQVPRIPAGDATGDAVDLSATARRSAGGDRVSLFRPSLAFNLLFDRPAPAEVAVAVAAPGAGTHTWFLYPRDGLLYAGTAHYPLGGNAGDLPRPTAPGGQMLPGAAPAATSPATPAAMPGSPAPPRAPTNTQIDEVIAQINAAVPQLELRRHQVARVYAGLLPAAQTGGTTLARHPVIRDHGAGGRGGGADAVVGLFSVAGVKYTTARDVAEQVLRRACVPLPAVRAEAGRPAAAEAPKLPAAGDPLAAETIAALRRLAYEEAALSADDLLLRRGAWADDPRRGAALADAVAAVFEGHND